MSTLNNKHLRRKTRQSDTNTKRVIHKFDAYYNPNDEKSKDRAYQYSLGVTKKEYKFVKKKAKEVGDAIRGVLEENLVGKINTEEVRLNLAEALNRIINDDTISHFDKVGEAWVNGMKEMYGGNLLERIQGQYIVNTKEMYEF